MGGREIPGDSLTYNVLSFFLLIVIHKSTNVVYNLEQSSGTNMGAP